MKGTLYLNDKTWSILYSHPTLGYTTAAQVLPESLIVIRCVPGMTVDFKLVNDDRYEGLRAKILPPVIEELEETVKWQVRFKDIDPDSGEVEQDLCIAVCSEERNAQWIKVAIERDWYSVGGSNDPNREFYTKPIFE